MIIAHSVEFLHVPLLRRRARRENLEELISSSVIFRFLFYVLRTYCSASGLPAPLRGSFVRCASGVT